VSALAVAPFVLYLLVIAALPLILARFWDDNRNKLAVALAAALPVAIYLLACTPDGAGLLAATAREYAAFIALLGALFVITSGIYVRGEPAATPAVNTAFLAAGAVLASLIGTTGASMLLIRPLLRINSERQHTGHLVPFFLLAVANAGGLLTPLGDPPLLVGFIGGVPFFWTLRLFPVWLLYVGSFVAAFYVIDRRAYARESAAALASDRATIQPLELSGRHTAS